MPPPVIFVSFFHPFGDLLPFLISLGMSFFHRSCLLFLRFESSRAPFRLSKGPKNLSPGFLFPAFPQAMAISGFSPGTPPLVFLELPPPPASPYTSKNCFPATALFFFASLAEDPHFFSSTLLSSCHILRPCLRPFFFFPTGFLSELLLLLCFCLEILLGGNFSSVPTAIPMNVRLFNLSLVLPAWRFSWTFGKLVGVRFVARVFGLACIVRPP